MEESKQQQLESVYNRRLAMVEEVKYKITIRSQWDWMDDYMDLIREEIELRYGKRRDLGQ